jgi:hypothetical protein
LSFIFLLWLFLISKGIIAFAILFPTILTLKVLSYKFTHFSGTAWLLCRFLDFRRLFLIFIPFVFAIEVSQEDLRVGQKTQSHDSKVLGVIPSIHLDSQVLILFRDGEAFHVLLNLRSGGDFDDYFLFVAVALAPSLLNEDCSAKPSYFIFAKFSDSEGRVFINSPLPLDLQSSLIHFDVHFDGRVNLFDLR